MFTLAEIKHLQAHPPNSKYLYINKMPKHKVIIIKLNHFLRLIYPFSVNHRKSPYRQAQLHHQLDQYLS
jgi:hypothetical protein